MNINELSLSDLKSLIEQYDLKASFDEENKLVIVNYNQISTPKNDITDQFRGVIFDYLDPERMTVVRRSMDRFYNYGEERCGEVDFNHAIGFEKLDGSFISLWYWPRKGTWNIATRGTIFAETPVGGFDKTFKELVLEGLEVKDMKQLQELCADLDTECTYNLEVTSKWNRVVRRYDTTSVWYLNERNVVTGEYYAGIPPLLEFKMPKQFDFSNFEDCVEKSKELNNLDEGFVIYMDGVPTAKVKSPAYVAAHRLRGEGLTPNRCSELVAIHEEEEYLAVFPEDADIVQPYVDAREVMYARCASVWTNTKNAEDQKTFALLVKEFPFSGVLFGARAKNISLEESWKNVRTIVKSRMIREYMNEEMV